MPSTISSIFRRLVLFSCLSLAACDDDSGRGGGDAIRGPLVVAIDGDPNGLFWDDAGQTLYVADDNGNRILSYTDSAGFALVRDLPAASPQGAGLGQVVRTGDGTLVVTRFGYGAAGDVVYVPSSGEPQVVPDLDVGRRRIGLTIADDGTLFDSWFVRLENGDRVGAVGRLDLSGAEPEVVSGLVKPVGVLALGDQLFVSDQDLGQVLRAPIADPSAYTVFATVSGPDLLAAGPEGSLFLGSTDGVVYRISSSGVAAVFETGFQQVRGVAYDPTNRRLFVAEHDGDESDGVDHAMHVLPVD